MESTGKYWVPVFNVLERRGIRVAIANPKRVKADYVSVKYEQLSERRGKKRAMVAIARMILTSILSTGEV